MTSTATLEQDTGLFEWFEAHLPNPSLETKIRADLESAGLLEVSVSFVNGKISRVTKHPELKAKTRIHKYSKFSEIRT